MKKRREKDYTDGPIGKTKIVRDFLPSPEELIQEEETVRVTLALSKESVDFFKAAAREHHTKYQRMIRHLIDLYVAQHKR